uniref:ER membrane protein complex subunit 1 n=1 Tax=Coprinellus disseminatus TaxID=71703 RepID=Q1WMU7_COPDI|nr:conserved hypothetical protein [Coprinellus disseminatus]
MTSCANASTSVLTFQDSFIFPHAITALAHTNTKYGISGKELIEGLFQYDPMIYDDPKRVISHTYDVAGVRQVATAPALLESTSLVFAFGLDMFLSRVAPSGTSDVLSQSFNKAQLVLTITGLAIAIVVTRPMVQRKRLREKWYH